MEALIISLYLMPNNNGILQQILRTVHEMKNAP